MGPAVEFWWCGSRSRGVGGGGGDLPGGGGSRGVGGGGDLGGGGSTRGGGSRGVEEVGPAVQGGVVPRCRAGPEVGVGPPTRNSGERLNR